MSFIVRTWTGDGNPTQTISGYGGKLESIIITREFNVFAVSHLWWFTDPVDIGGPQSNRTLGGNGAPADALVTANVVGSFTTTANLLGFVYHCLGWKEDAESHTGFYTGNGVDPQTIATLGVEPDFVYISSFPPVDSAAGQRAPIAMAATMFRTNLVETLSGGLDTAGGLIRVSASLNTAGVAYYWMAFKNAGLGGFESVLYHGTAAIQTVPSAMNFPTVALAVSGGLIGQKPSHVQWRDQIAQDHWRWPDGYEEAADTCHITGWLPNGVTISAGGFAGPGYYVNSPQDAPFGDPEAMLFFRESLPGPPAAVAQVKLTCEGTIAQSLELCPGEC